MNSHDVTLRYDILKIAGVIIAFVIISAAAVLIITEQLIQIQKEQVLEQKVITAKSLAGRFEHRLNDAGSILQIAARGTEFAVVPYADEVSDEFKGIPITLEQDKRNIARNILSEYGNFETVSFILPNADVYFVEPYESQISLPRLNFADREWYQGVINTGRPYIGDAIISAASGNRVIPMAVPVYDDAGLIGMIVAGLNVEAVEGQLREDLDLSNNNRVIYVDDNGNAIQDIASDQSQSYKRLESVSQLKGVSLVLKGERGHVIDDVDGVQTLVVYEPIVLGSEEWGLLLLQPIREAYAASEDFREQSYVLIVVIVAIGGAAGFFLVSFRKNSTVSKQLHKANLELIEKDKLKDEFLKIASHELRTPIQPIIGYASLGERGLIKDNKAWKVVHKEAQRLMRLSNNIVDITMVQSGILTYNMERTRIMELVQSVVESYRPSVQEKRLSLELNFDEKCDKIEIDADAPRLKRVFGELFDNAIKFTEKGGIKVECKAGAETFVIRISDTGTAIPADFLPRIFGMFSSQSVNDPTTQGAGLGLFISKAIITAHGGTIVARNNIEGPGAVFEVTLPLYSLQEFAPRTKAALS